MLAHLDRRLAQGTKERCVIIVLGFSDDPLSNTYLTELPIDVSNLWFWKTAHLPGIIRVATLKNHKIEMHGMPRTISSKMEPFKSLLTSLRTQYFESPRFDSGSPSQVSTTSESAPKLFNYDKERTNQYDIVLCGRAFEDGAAKFFREILALHKSETAHASKNISSQYGSGGSLYLLQGRLVSSVSGWRRVDWLVMAQCQFLPRLWNLDDPPTLQELLHLFNYRHWLTRFDGLEPTDEAVRGFIDYPDSDAESVFAALDEQKKQEASIDSMQGSACEARSTSKKVSAAKKSSSPASTSSKEKGNSTLKSPSSPSLQKPTTSFHRRKREADWDNIHGAESLASVQLVKAVSALQPKGNASLPAFSSNKAVKPVAKPRKVALLEGETNHFRITEGHFVVWRELITSLNREGWYRESLDVIHRHARGAPESRRFGPTPVDFYKLEGVALLGSGRKEDAIRMLTKYRDHLEAEEEDKRLLGLNSSINSSISVHEDDVLGDLDAKTLEKQRKEEASKTWAEVASVYSACGEFVSAQGSATKALRLDNSNISAQRTLVMAVVRTGSSSFEEEDFIFSFFALNSKSVQLQAQEAAEYYHKRIVKHPMNGHFWYGYAMFSFVLARDMEAAGSIFQKSLDLLPDQPRIAESFATFLFQSRSTNLSKILSLYEDALRMDPSNLITRANTAAFLLFFHSAQLEHLNGSVKTHLSDHDPFKLSDNDMWYKQKSISSRSRLQPKSDNFISDILDNEEVKYAMDNSSLDSNREDIMEGFERAQSILESVLFSASLLDQHPQVYLECWFYVVCYTMEADRATQALQYLKAALRKGIRARNWDMAMHVRFLALRSHEDYALPASEWHWILKLLEVIGDRMPIETLDKWTFWVKLKSDRLVRNLLLTAQSFRVCVSPSKRRERKEDISPATKRSTTLASTSSKSSNNKHAIVPIPISSSLSASSKSSNKSQKNLTLDSHKTPPMKKGSTFGGFGRKQQLPLKETSSKRANTNVDSNDKSSEEDSEVDLSMLDTPTITPTTSKIRSPPQSLECLSRLSSHSKPSPTSLSYDFFAAVSDSDEEKASEATSKTPPSLSRGTSSSASFLKTKGSSSAPSKSLKSSTTAASKKTSSSTLTKSGKVDRKSSISSLSQSTSSPAEQAQIWKSLLDKYKDPEVQYTEEVDTEVRPTQSTFDTSQGSFSSPLSSSSPTATSLNARSAPSSAGTRKRVTSPSGGEISAVPPRPKRSSSELFPLTRSKRQKVE
jgi:tetratricopeptide (TPR) repeat protein